MKPIYEKSLTRGALETAIAEAIMASPAEPLALHPTVLMLGPGAETGTLNADGEFVPTSVSKLPPTHARMKGRL